MHHIAEMFGFTLPIWFRTGLCLKLTNDRKDVPLDIPLSRFLRDLTLFSSFNLACFPFKNGFSELKKVRIQGKNKRAVKSLLNNEKISILFTEDSILMLLNTLLPTPLGQQL